LIPSSIGIYFVGVALGGLVLLVVFSILAMARKQDEDQDRLEIKLRRENLRLGAKSTISQIGESSAITRNILSAVPGASRRFFF
jgi:hypothetical protein